MACLKKVPMEEQLSPAQLFCSYVRPTKMFDVHLCLYARVCADDRIYSLFSGNFYCNHMIIIRCHCFYGIRLMLLNCAEMRVSWNTVRFLIKLGLLSLVCIHTPSWDAVQLESQLGKHIKFNTDFSFVKVWPHYWGQISTLLMWY